MSLRIAAFPKCWITEICSGQMALFEWIACSVELHCDGLELYSGFLRSYRPSYLRSVRRNVEDLGMSIPMLCFSPDFTTPDARARRREVRRQIEAIRVTAELGGSFCRTLSGQRRPGVPVGDGIRWTVECIERCLPDAEQCGICLVIENHYKDGFWTLPEFAQKSEVLLEILDRLPSPRLGVQYDPSNALLAGEDPVVLLDRLLPRVRTVHASDRYLRPGFSLESLKAAEGTTGYADSLVHGVTGKGAIDYEAIFSRLAGVRFDGWMSIEDGMNGMAEMKESVEFLKLMRSRHRLE